MPEHAETPGLDRLQAALADGDMERVRGELLALGPEDQRLLAQSIGPGAARRARAAAGRGRRAAKLGRVVVLPGIMGTLLDSVDRGGDADRIWLHYLRLIFGRIEDLELTLDGEPAKPGLHVRTAGLYSDFYLPMLMELDTRWHVRPFGYDWREDIEKSAARLDGEIRAFGGGEPVHLVAHSMGGLVSRWFVRCFPQTWRSMADPQGKGRGGRLVMLGTPNRGSFEIPTVFTATHDVIKKLDIADLKHSQKGLLDIIATFPGLYQTLPSHLVDLGDDHVKLFKTATWGRFTTHQELLDAGKAFHEGLDRVVDPDRLLYLAGYGRTTLASVKVARPGELAYRTTVDGDGTVPHRLGLLEGVETYWVNDGHADLVRNDAVLDAIHELLSTGRTNRLPKTKPAPPRRAPAESRAFRRPQAARPQEVRRAEAAERARLRQLRDRAVGRAGEPELPPEEAVEFQRLVFASVFGRSRAPEELAERDGGPGDEAPGPRRRRLQTLPVEVVWGDVRQVEADVYAVGHYQGVPPQRAERALDCAVSNVSWEEAKTREGARRLIITEHTRRGLLRGALGELELFPWGEPGGKGRVVAVAGMGHPGTFDLAALRFLSHQLAVAVAVLPNATTLCTVLIGSGLGTLTTDRAVRGLLDGIEEALVELAEQGVPVTGIKKLVVVELYRERAEEIRRALASQAAERKKAPIGFKVGPEVVAGADGRVSAEGGLELLLGAAVRAARARKGTARRLAVDELLGGLPAGHGLREQARAQVEKLATASGDAGGLLLDGYRVEARGDGGGATADAPARISFTWDDGVVRVAAITGSTTVPERIVAASEGEIDELVASMTDPSPKALKELSKDLARLLVPREFRQVLEGGPFVIEVDRAMARVHWEACATFSGGAPTDSPMGLDQLSRQLRTTYSPPPAPAPYRGGPLKALVIGDPGDPAEDLSLPGARREALAVCELLEAKGVEVTKRIGAPDAGGNGPVAGIQPAGRFEVLRLLRRGGFDILHYAGHGDFDPEHPERVGWIFKGGLVTPAELGQVDELPSLLVANACLSARTSAALAAGRKPDDPRSEAALLPSLADEFFKLGVRNYVGAAWEVNDFGAELFAKVFYETLLARRFYGEAMHAARTELHRRRADYGSLWAAYQHYGDPAAELRPAATPEEGEE